MAYSDEEDKEFIEEVRKIKVSTFPASLALGNYKKEGYDHTYDMNKLSKKEEKLEEAQKKEEKKVDLGSITIKVRDETKSGQVGGYPSNSLYKHYKTKYYRTRNLKYKNLYKYYKKSNQI